MSSATQLSTAEWKSLSDLVAGTSCSKKGLVQQEFCRRESGNSRVLFDPLFESPKSLHPVVALRPCQRHVRMKRPIFSNKPALRRGSEHEVLQPKHLRRDPYPREENSRSLEEASSIKLHGHCG